MRGTQGLVVLSDSAYEPFQYAFNISDSMRVTSLEYLLKFAVFTNEPHSLRKIMRFTGATLLTKCLSKWRETPLTPPPSDNLATGLEIVPFPKLML